MTEIVSAEVLSEDDPNATERRERLRASSDVVCVDHVPALRAELEKLASEPDTALLQEPCAWVYYPWRRVMVRLLGPLGFERLRLDRNRNKITATEQSVLRSRTVAVVGLSVGSASALLLAREGLCGALKLADFDTIELSNLNRVWASVLDIGCNKAVAAARHVAEIDPYLPVQIEPTGLRSENIGSFLEGVDLLVEECDSLDIKVNLRLAARSRRIPVLMETSDRGLLDVERFDIDPQRPILHGLVDGLDPERLGGLSTDEKVPYVLRILEADKLSPRLAASLVEIDEQLTTWPQLAGDVALGSTILASAIRRWALEPSLLSSGRVRVDIPAHLDRLAEPGLSRVEEPPPVTTRARLPSPLHQAVVAAAALAPSGGNVQPWRIEARGDCVDIWLDPSRTSGLDIAYRGSLVAIGAALCNAWVVAADRGRRGRIELFPDASAPDLVGRIDFGAIEERSLTELAEQVTWRVSNRRHGDRRPVSPENRGALERECVAEGAGLAWLEGAVLDEVARIWAESDRIRYLTPRLHREMMSELRRPGLDDLSDGIDLRTLELTPTDVAKLDIARREDVMSELRGWKGGVRLGEDTRDRLLSSSALGAVTYPARDAGAYVRGGIALERMWLRAQRLGLGIQPMSPVFLYGHDEAELVEIAGPDHGRSLASMRRAFLTFAGVPQDHALVLTFRVSHALPPSALSQRRS